MNRIEFKPIPNERKPGYTALDIYPPGQFMDESDWMAFVGGCGVGHADSREAAEQLLLNRALDECTRQIQRAEHTIHHYREQRAVLIREGLRPIGVTNAV